MKKKIDLLAQTTEKSGTDYLGIIELESFRHKCILNFKGKTQKGRLRKIEISKNPQNGKMCPVLNDKVHRLITLSIEEKIKIENLNSNPKNTNYGLASGSIKIEEEEYLIFFENKNSPAKVLNQRPRPLLMQQSASS
ncbi:MAG: hypothetical protein KBD48_00585 [Candidatus Pacebacteria bacterium]|nr:hypothetical protein [Candidatus Paceibacterota bacterium]MBP9715676.1 hypothetical protein [Candidatus Paceibacterota bacterium]